LDKHLDPSAEPSIAVRAVYGQWFPSLHFLDRDWATARMSAIFPHDAASKDLREAAWNTYIMMCQPNDEVFGLLEEAYRQAIDRIRTSAETNTHRGDPDLRLAQHLITQYWRGNLDVEDQDGLLAHFYAKADSRLRKSVAPEVVERLKKFWTWRLDVLRAAGAAAPQMEEVRDFGWWFASRKFPDERSIEQLSELLKITGRIEPDHLVVERLAELSEAMPAKAVECLAMIVEGDKDGWGVLSWREHAHAVLATAMHSGDETARNRARDLVHHLGARGYFEFRHLLQ
jgi:hypothetical protein